MHAVKLWDFQYKPSSLPRGYLLAVRTCVLWWTLAGIAVDSIHTRPSILALVSNAVVNIYVAALPDIAFVTLALEICHFIYTHPVNTGIGFAVINIGLTKEPFPPSAASTVESIEQILARACMMAWARSTDICSLAA